MFLSPRFFACVACRACSELNKEAEGEKRLGGERALQNFECAHDAQELVIVRLERIGLVNDLH